MAQIIKHRRGSLEALSQVTSSLQKGEIIIASGSSLISASNGSSLVFAVVESGSVQAVNRVMRTTGSVAPIFSASIYNGMVDGVPFYASGSSTLYLLGSNSNEAVNLEGNIQPFSTSVDSRLDSIETSIGGGGTGIGARVGNLEAVSQSLQNFTASQEAKDVIISAYTASMNTFSSSQQAKDVTISAYTASMNTFTASINGHVTDINSFTSSQQAKDVIISAYTASMNTFTSSQEAKDVIISAYTASMNTFTSSQEAKDVIISAYTASMNTFTASVNSDLARIHESTSSLNDYTASLKAAITASGTNITINGDLTVKGTTTAVNSTTVQLGDNIIELNGTGAANGGLVVKDPTAPNTVSGSLLWDSTNDYWKAGALGSEERILRAGGSDHVISGSVQVDINNTTGFTTYSSSVSASVSALSASVAAGNIWQQTGSAYDTINNITITGSLSTTGKISTQSNISASQSITASNINVGTPTSNAWQANLSGSYFNNFTANTDVSEILRFVAGLLSSSAPDASPNTRTFSSYTAAATNTTTGTALTGRIPQSSTNTTVTYLSSKGFATAGSTIFNGISTIYTDPLYQVSYTSVAGGSTIVTSSADAQLFGLGQLSSGNPTTFNVSGSFTHRFKDNSTKTDTATSSSQVIISQSGAGTTNGVTLAKINTVNPNVIPPAYQDGKFASVLPQKIYTTGSTSTINVTGYYDITASITIASGSSGYTAASTVTNGIFYAPLSTISTNVPVQTPATGSTTVTALTAVSRSLSGAPYLSGSTWAASSSWTGLFNPLYVNNSSIATFGTDSNITLSGTTYTATINASAQISTANTVYDSTGTTVRATLTIPYETDIVKLNGIHTHGGSNITNIGQSSNSPTSWTFYNNGRNYNNTLTQKTLSIPFHTAGDFGQPVSSGSLAYFTRTQGSDSSTALVEVFTGENYRIQLANNVLTFSGSAWPTTFGLYNLTGNDLQVKPGYLVKPGGTYGYWLGDPDSSKTYKYYIRKITTSGTKTSMTLNLGTSLVNWSATTNNSVAAVVLFESSNSNIYAKARVYDPSDLTSNFIATQTANTDGMNPFGSNIDLYGNTGGSLASNTYTIPLRNADGMIMNATYTNAYVIVRYKGDPTPITGITATFS
jgi:hypothetical protein